MAAADVAQPVASEAPAPAVPDYMLDANAVLKDDVASWRFGRAPDYSNTRRVWAQTKKSNHADGSLEQMVENLVKNWEIEASFKTNVSDWRTVDNKVYTFAINGGPPQDAEHMLKVGTYNAILAPNSFYSSEHSDFEKSHKTFKRMMPTFAWEVMEVYSPPPRVAFRWRHWGEMKNDYVGWNDKGEKITIKAHGGLLDIQGVTIATVDEGFKVQKLETWFDPLEMFRQFTPKDVKVNGKPVSEAEGSESILAVKALIEQVENKVKVGDNKNGVHVEVDNPHAGDHQRHEHDESRTMATPAREVPPGHPEVEGANPSGACPFLSGGSASQ